VTGTAPISVATGTTTPAISITQATTSANGYLSSTDWNTFNSKLSSTLSSADIFVGNSSNAATAVALSGDATLTNAGVLRVTGIEGVAISGTATSGQSLEYNGTNWVPFTPALSSSLSSYLPLAGGTMTGALDKNTASHADALAQILASTGASTNKGIVVQGVASQSANLQEWQNNSGTVLSSVSSAGKLTVPTLEVTTSPTSGYVLTSDASGNATWQAQAISGGAITGVVGVANGGTNLSTTPTNGQLLIGNGTNYTLATLTGTTNEVNVTNASGSITLSAPQAIATTSAPTFGGETLNGNLTLQNGSAAVKLAPPSSGSTVVTWTLPDSTGTANQVLSTDGSGNLSWTTVLSSGSTLNASNITTGTLDVANGGSGVTSHTLDGVLVGNGTNGVISTSAGSQYQPLVANASGSAPSFQALPLNQSAAVTGALAVANGGTGSSTLTANNVLLGNGTSALQTVSPATSGNYLRANGTTWASSSLQSGDLPTGTLSGSGVASYLAQYTSANVLGVSPMYATSTSIGIGNTSPGQLLTLGTAATTTGTLGLANGGTSGAVVTMQNLGATSAYNFNLPAAAGSSGQCLQSAGGATSSMTWGNCGSATGNWSVNSSNLYYNSGNVGIGTNSPGANLAIATSTAQDSLDITAYYGQTIRFDDAGQLINSAGPSLAYDYNLGTYALTNYANALYISSGTNSSTAYNIIIKPSGSGQVGIINTSPSYPLDVTGDIRTSTCLHYASSTLGTCSSDERIKKDVHPFGLGLKETVGLNPVFFKYNGLGGNPDDGVEQMGVIAQQVEKIAPSLVVTKKVKLHPDDKNETEIKAVNYSAFTYMLINSVKELYAKITHHDDLLASLKAENSRLNARIENLERNSFRAPAAASVVIDVKQFEQMKAENAELKARLDRLEKQINQKTPHF
jgi:cell division protein FtsB